MDKDEENLPLDHFHQIQPLADVEMDSTAVAQEVTDAVEKIAREEIGVAAPISNPVKSETVEEVEAEVMKKLTDAMKQRIIEYIERMETVDNFSSSTNCNGSAWISFFIQFVCRPEPLESVTKKDVLVWIKNCPEIFTPEVVANFREIYKRFMSLVIQKRGVDERLRERMKELEDESLDYKEQQQ